MVRSVRTSSVLVNSPRKRKPRSVTMVKAVPVGSSSIADSSSAPAMSKASLATSWASDNAGVAPNRVNTATIQCFNVSVLPPQRIDREGHSSAVGRVVVQAVGQRAAAD